MRQQSNTIHSKINIYTDTHIYTGNTLDDTNWENSSVYIKGVNPWSNMGGDNIVMKYTSRLWDVSRGAPHLARRVRGHAPPRKLF